MDSSTLSPSDRDILRDTYNSLLKVNDDLHKVQLDLFRTSDLCTPYRDSSENPHRPEHWVRSNSRAHWDDKEGSEAWAIEARSKGLFDSRPALAEELKCLSDRKGILEDIQHQLRLSINGISKPSLRKWHILDLPDEILSGVFDLVEGFRPDMPTLWRIASKDIKNCRLACRKFYRVSSSSFIRSVPVDLQVSSLSRFEEISHHPIISKGVRVIRVVLHFYHPILSDNFDDFILYHATQLQGRADGMERIRSWEFDDISEETGRGIIQNLRAISASWRRIAAGLQAQDLTENDHTHLLLLRTAHQKYQRLCSDQEELLKSGKFAQRLAAGIARMPRARTLYFLDWDLSGPNGTSLLNCEDLNVPIYTDIIQPMNFYTAYQHGFVPRLCETITKLPMAVQDFGTLLEGIYIELSYVTSPSDLLPSSEAQQLLPSAMQQLHSFSFKCRQWRNEASGQSIVHDLFAPCLNTPSIQELVVDMIDEEESQDPSVFDVSNLITLQQWPNLSYVFLRGVSFRLSEFQIFLGNSCNSSLSLALESVQLLSGTWEVALDGLRHKPPRFIQLSDPLGAECEDLSSEELSNIFDRGSSLWNEAELYVRSITRQNPLRSG
ncbi:hypothetical protein B0I35DRAFT_441847 [Stachybotrys elegans]|uniref:F-box domain-containing protein n=1 Tax=Stachybotrys elegans TaxID=80388 RepID=A0A8K0WKZ6_9HYPO|nr:hypothetical protein B0I35DRAFT_441847 [Stachybotrys elegans]